MPDGSLLSEVVDAHGGLQRWRQIRELRLDVRVGGNILAWKFKSPRTRSVECRVCTRDIHIMFSPFPKPGRRGIFDGDSVRIEDDHGAIIALRQVVRTAAGKVKKRIAWDDLDLLYFLGYALWNYVNTPFLFLWPGFECSEAGTWREKNGETWRKLDVTYPHAFPTHSRKQTFYFDATGLLRRLDYTAEVFGDFARGAHYCEAHKEFAGILFPTHRIVFIRPDTGHPFRLFPVMEGWVESVSAFSG